MRTTIILMSIGLTVLSACGGVEREDAASNATSLSPPAVPSRSAASASSSVAPGQLDVDAFLRTDPEIVSRFGATPHGVRLACAFTPIVPRSDAHLYARFVCLEVMGTGPRAYSMSGSASSIALTIDPKTGQASSWRIPRDGAQGAQDLQEMFPPDVLAAFGSSDTETLNRVTAEMPSRCLAIASELGRMS